MQEQLQEEQLVAALQRLTQDPGPGRQSPMVYNEGGSVVLLLSGTSQTVVLQAESFKQNR